MYQPTKTEKKQYTDYTLNMTNIQYIQWLINITQNDITITINKSNNCIPRLKYDILESKIDS